MLFEYAVEPEAIGSSWQTFLYLSEKFGFDRGRLISRFPGKWERKVIQAAKEAGVPEVRLASIVERLLRLKAAVVDFDRCYHSDMSWTANALAEHQRVPFHAIIAQNNFGGSAAVVPLADLDELHPLVAMTRDSAVPREAGSIAQALSGFLRFGTRIMFIDPFFDPYNARYKSTLRECLAVVKSINPAASCEVHYRYHDNKPANIQLEAEAANLFRGVIPEGLALSVYCWRERHGGADFHARYLLTEHGGVAIDAGFSAEGGHQTTDMHLLSFALAEERRSGYARDATQFELIEPILEIRFGGSVRRIAGSPDLRSCAD